MPVDQRLIELRQRAEVAEQERDAAQSAARRLAEALAVAQKERRSAWEFTRALLGVDAEQRARALEPPPRRRPTRRASATKRTESA